MMAALAGGILGGIVGALVVVLALFWPGHRLGRFRFPNEAERFADLSYRLWRLYVDLVSGLEIRANAPRALHEEVLLAASGSESDEDSSEALFEMTSILSRARGRAGEFRRVGLDVSQAQFADLTDRMREAFVRVQLGAATGRGRIGGVVTDLNAARTRRYA